MKEDYEERRGGRFGGNQKRLSLLRMVMRLRRGFRTVVEMNCQTKLRRQVGNCDPWMCHTSSFRVQTRIEYSQAGQSDVSVGADINDFVRQSLYLLTGLERKV